MAANEQIVNDIKLKKYSLKYLRLSKMILEMNDKQRSNLLRYGKEIFSQVNDSSNWKFLSDRQFIFVYGLLAGWALASFVYLYLTIS